MGKKRSSTGGTPNNAYEARAGYASGSAEVAATATRELFRALKNAEDKMTSKERLNHALKGLGQQF